MRTVTLVRMRDFQITRWEATILFTLAKFSKADTWSFRNWGGDISQQFGLQKIKCMIRTLHSRFKSQRNITLKLRLTRLKYLIKSRHSGKSRSGRTHWPIITEMTLSCRREFEKISLGCPSNHMIVTLYSWWITSYTRVLMVNTT